jgi:transposase
MKTFFVGIDISKDWLDVCVYDEELVKAVLSFRSDNTIEGIEEVIDQCKTAAGSNKLWCCFEHTGSYGLLLARILEEHAVVYSAVPALEIKQSIGITRGKNDRVDALRIAQYATVNRHKLSETKLPEEHLLVIKNLLTYRSQLLKTSQGLQNSRKSYLIVNKTANVQVIIDDLNLKIASLKLDIVKLEKAIKAEIATNKELASSFKRIMSVKGVGLMIAATMLVCTKNFTTFENPRKFNCYAGLAPFAHASGSSIQGKTKTSSLRNKKMKTLLCSGANSAVNHDLEMKAYYKRKLKEGKHHNSIINAVACKIVYRVFAVVKRAEPYVNLVR